MQRCSHWTLNRTNRQAETRWTASKCWFKNRSFKPPSKALVTSMNKFLSTNFSCVFSLFTPTSWQPSAEVVRLGLNPASYWPDTRCQTEGSLLTHEEVQCTLDKMLPLNSSLSLYTHTHTHTHTHTYTHTHTGYPSSPSHLCWLPLRSVYLTASGWQATAAPLLGPVRVHTGAHVSWAAWANMGSGGDPKSNPYVAPMLPFFFSPEHRLKSTYCTHFQVFHFNFGLL